MVRLSSAHEEVKAYVGDCYHALSLQLSSLGYVCQNITEQLGSREETMELNLERNTGKCFNKAEH